METENVFLSVGATVALFGTAMVVWHVLQHRRHQEDISLSAASQKFFDQQYRRRMQTSALTVLLGALISFCETLPIFRSSPIFATFYVTFLLLLAFWLVLLAFGDALSTRVHLSQAIRENRKARQALQDAVDELRRQQNLRSGGDHEQSAG
jgi:hypothetical protein